MAEYIVTWHETWETIINADSVEEVNEKLDNITREDMGFVESWGHEIALYEDWAKENGR